MENITPWSLLRGNSSEQEQGMRLIQQTYEQVPTPSHIIGLGVAYLWLRHYSAAFDHFQIAIKTDPRCGDSYFGMAGVAKWCLGEPNEAVAIWKAGLKVKYARAGLAVRMPMLLFFASIVKPQSCERSLAQGLLLEKIENPRIKHWPGPIAKMLLGQITEHEFQNECLANEDVGTIKRYWLPDFYRIILQHNPGKTSDLKEAMRKLTDTSESEWSDEKLFLHRIWREEFFLARHEANWPQT